jgi:hypothetical protein
MSEQLRTTPEELKERLQVLQVRLPTDNDVVNGFGAVEAAFREDVSDLLNAIRANDHAGDVLIDPSKVPRAKARMLIRSIFATIEGLVYSMKQLAFEVNNGVLTLDELLVCRELNFGLKDDGEVRLVPTQLRLKGNVRFAFATLAKVFHQPFTLQTGGQGWEKFGRSVDVRNRLTHPRKKADLDLSDEEIVDAVAAWTWFDGQFIALMGMLEADAIKSNEFFSAMLREVRLFAEKQKNSESSRTGG